MVSMYLVILLHEGPGVPANASHHEAAQADVFLSIPEESYLQYEIQSSEACFRGREGS